MDGLLIEAVGVALRAARITDGLVDPTVGEAMLGIGYDRDFAKVALNGPALSPAPSWISVADWRRVELRPEHREIRIPRGMRLDLGSTAKALAADRAAVRAAGVSGCGVLVSLGGDIAVGGDAPEGGWPIGIADDHAAEPEPGETIIIASGGLATSSTTVRRWTRGGVPVHHIVDPRTGSPAHARCGARSRSARARVWMRTPPRPQRSSWARKLPDWLARRGCPPVW